MHLALVVTATPAISSDFLFGIAYHCIPLRGEQCSGLAASLPTHLHTPQLLLLVWGYVVHFRDISTTRPAGWAGNYGLALPACQWQADRVGGWEQGRRVPTAHLSTLFAPRRCRRVRAMC